MYFLMKLQKNYNLIGRNELKVSDADAFNLSFYACEELKLEVSVSDTFNAWISTA